MPGLAVVIVGDDPASQVYVRNKRRACEQVGFYSEGFELPADTTQETLEALVDRLNEDDRHPRYPRAAAPAAPSGRRAHPASHPPDKDVMPSIPTMVGRLLTGNYSFLPCTPAGIMELLARYGISCDGKECVVVGRSNIVGKPMAMLMLQANGTVTVCHSHTRNLAEVTRRADILVAAIGRADFFTADMVKPGAVVVDVGMNRRADGKLTGDVDFASVEPVASAITPVPGGVGPMTITMLLRNTLTAAECFARGGN